MYRQSEKNLLSSNISSTCAHNMVNFGPLAAEIVSGVRAPQLLSTASASWQRYCTAWSSGRQPNFAALNRGRHLCLAGRPSRWALAHILVTFCVWHVYMLLLVQMWQLFSVHCVPFVNPMKTATQKHMLCINLKLSFDKIHCIAGPLWVPGL